MGKTLSSKLPVAIRLSPGARIAPGGRMKQLFGAVVWNYSKNKKKAFIRLAENTKSHESEMENILLSNTYAMHSG